MERGIFPTGFSPEIASFWRDSKTGPHSTTTPEMGDPIPCTIRNWLPEAAPGTGTDENRQRRFAPPSL